jgi:predicted nucleic acid-binding Zn ribbon protein
MKRINTKLRMNRIICLNDEIDIFMNSLGIDAQIQKYRIKEFWSQIVGDVISQYAIPYELKKDKLCISVQDSTWRYELSLQKEEILKSLNKLLRTNKINKYIKDIIFV